MCKTLCPISAQNLMSGNSCPSLALRAGVAILLAEVISRPDRQASRGVGGSGCRHGQRAVGVEVWRDLVVELPVVGGGSRDPHAIQLPAAGDNFGRHQG